MSREQLFRLLYVVWALPCLAVSTWLASSKGGHPPGIILVPVVALVWLIGQLMLWGSHRLIRSGLARTDRRGGKPTWPPSLLIAIVGCGVMSFLAVLFIGSQAFEGRLTNRWNLLMLAALLPHPICFVGLLLRQRWARVLTTLLAAGWSAYMIVQIVDHLWRQSPIEPWEMGVAVLWIATFGLLAWRLATSDAVSAYFATSEATKAE